ncbi:hypothetical protein B0T11DRAFT_3002 [Plectosphaerella cucumerina]|uniref:Repetitive proline-rich cell wall protein n=1 Tax=Plectosphaerella cucumerina TaxID=40658 RepID=A0A8K0TU92_9PEZI|nr:hypothetical protein B0T11DRAFT_3002 [Plectosphaerella cucumerina]
MKFGTAVLLALPALALATDDYGDDDYCGKYGGCHWDTATVTTVVEVTTTSPCPTTEIVYEGGNTYTKTYTKYTTVVEKVPTTIYQTVKKPDQTVYDKAYETKTITKEHPVTETKYVDGETVVVVHTETEYIKTWVPVTHYATVEAPDVTHTSKEVAYQTITKEHPVTQTKTVEGEVIVVTYTETEYIKTYVPVTHYETVTGADITKTADHQETVIVTKGQDTTVTKTVPGEVVYVTETCTEYATQVNVVTVHVTAPAEHKTTSVYTTVAVSEGSEVTVTIPGEVIYETETCTEYATQENVVTVHETGPAVHKTTSVYTTVTVTEGSEAVVTAPGEVIYETVHKTVTETVHGAPSTVVVPPVVSTTEVIETETTTVIPPPATTEPVEVPSDTPVPAGAAEARAPLMAIVVAAAGAVAFL